MKARSCFVFAGVLVSVVASVRSDAAACYNSMMSRIDPAISIVGEAERLVENGNPRDAIAWVHDANPAFAKREIGKAPLSDRALSVLARAVVRSGGGEKVADLGDVGEAGQVAWATTTLRGLSDKNPSDPGRTTHLAEALALAPETQGEALRMLAQLEQGGLVTSPYGYATLAKLRRGSSADKPAFVAAQLATLQAGRIKLELSRCEKMAKDPGLCSGKPASPAKPNPVVKAHVAAENARIDMINGWVGSGHSGYGSVASRPTVVVGQPTRN